MAEATESNDYIKSALLLIAVATALVIFVGVIFQANKARPTPIPPSANAPIDTPVPLAMVTIDIEVPNDSIVFRDDQYRIFFTYPKNWAETGGKLIFTQGDLAHLSFSGGSSFAVGVPVVTEKDAATMAKEINGVKSETTGKPLPYSKVTIGRNKFEKVVDCDDLCVTHYYSYHNGNVYMFYSTTGKANAKAHEAVINSVLKTLVLF